MVFDFDGLLMDTETTMLRSWQNEWNQWGLTLDVGAFFVDHGGDVTEHRYDALGRAVGERFDRDLSHRRRTAYRDGLHVQLDLSDGIHAWLEQAATVGLDLAIASSSPVEWVQSHLQRVGARHYFRVVAGGDEVPRTKPAPDVYLLALRKLDVGADWAVAVEDSPHGVHAALAAGMRCIAIPNPNVAPARVAHADLVLRSAKSMTLDEALSRVHP
jgi:HAD superfamily hydrolase (TIGR01509 family)